jgi:hypothetical protein
VHDRELGQAVAGVQDGAQRCRKAQLTIDRRGQKP